MPSRPRRLLRPVVEIQQMAPIAGWIDVEPAVKSLLSHSSMLESPLGKDRQLQAGHLSDSAAQHLAFETVESFVGALGELSERDGLGHGDDPRPTVGAEQREAVPPGGGVAPDASPAQAAAVGQGVLDGLHSPAFLIEHPVVDDAANGQLRVLLDGIVLEVLVAAVAVGEVSPVGIALADASKKGEAHGRALHVERLVVLNGFHGRVGTELRAGALDRFSEYLEAGSPEDLPRLLKIIAAAIHGEGERLEAGRALAGSQKLVVKAEEQGAAVDA